MTTTSSPTAAEAASGPQTEPEYNMSREAARYRVRLRETEAERDQLRTQLDHAQTAQVERLAQAAGLAMSQDVWLHGASLATMRGEDGSIDPETVNGLVADLLRDRPGLQAVPIGDVGIGRGGAASPRNHPTPGLSRLLKEH